MNSRMAKWYIAVVIDFTVLTIVPLSEARKTPPNPSLFSVSQKGFNPDGGYDVFGELPKGFGGVSRLLVFRSLGRRRPRFSSALQTSVNPSTGKIVEHKFIASVITRDKFIFTTASIRGVSYRFEGRFLSDQPYRVEESKPAIEGQLTKFQNGNKVAEAKIAFASCVCVE